MHTYDNYDTLISNWYIKRSMALIRPTEFGQYLHVNVYTYFLDSNGHVTSVKRISDLRTCYTCTIWNSGSCHTWHSYNQLHINTTLCQCSFQTQILSVCNWALYGPLKLVKSLGSVSVSPGSRVPSLFLPYISRLSPGFVQVKKTTLQILNNFDIKKETSKAI